jgi:release factor glutamine methyltransferase
LDLETALNMLLREIKNIYHSELDAIYKQEEVDSFFYLVIGHYLDLERFVLAIKPQLVVTKAEEQSLFEALGQLKLEKPIQYILGSTQFMDLEFKVNENVLIPRPETEELVRWIINDFEIIGDKEINILDIGTGSGCIAITLAKYLKNAKVDALDISKNALEVARENASLNKVDVGFIEADILKLEYLEDKYDIIVSNPPYVRMLEKEQIKSNVIENEPELALFVEDKDPLVFYRKISELAKSNLKKGGCLYFELNQYLGEKTKALLKNDFYEVELHKDMFGNDRMLNGKLKN